MRRAYHHVDDWECAAAGLYADVTFGEPELKRAVKVLTTECRSAMQQVVEQWPKSCDQVFTDTARNRRAWLGRAAVFIRADLPMCVTRPAWFLLTPPERERANRIADEIIAAWERDYERRSSCQNRLWG